MKHFTPDPAAAPFSAPPPLTVLKPLCGSEGRLYECLRSFCIQDYPGLQIVCGIAATEDKASAIVRRIMSEFPDLDRATQPAGHFAGVFTCAFPILLGLVSLRPSVLGIVLLAAILVLRLLLRLVVHQRLGRRGSPELWLVPLRELLCFIVWLASYGGRAVTWRGHALAIAQNGTLVAGRRRHAVASLAGGGRAMRPRRAA